MNLLKYSKEIQIKTGIGIYAQIVNVLLLLTVIMLAIALMKADRTHRETLIPPGITKTMWVEDERASPEYLEQMGMFLLQLALNRNPANAEAQLDMLLRYVAPDSYGTLQKQIRADLRRQQEEQVSTLFHPQGVTIAEDRNDIMFTGVLVTYVADKPVKNEQKRYLIRFRFGGGRTYIQEILDVTQDQDPFLGSVTKESQLTDQEEGNGHE